MFEKQDIEYKQTWKDEYLKWICGLANSHGGRIYIGVDDNGNIIGVTNSNKLLTDIPNKVRDTLGIIVDVNLLNEFNKEYIEIIVKKSAHHVNYNGEYYLRSGATNQLLRGTALASFIAENVDNHWDALPVDNISVEDLDRESIDIFRREAVKNGRMSKEDIMISDKELLDHLNLFVNEKLKRAAVMLFYKRPDRLISGCYIKIGKFGNGADLQYQDILEGSLFSMADKVIDLIYTKYLKATVTYENDVRIETFPFPRDGVREAIYNALGHNNFIEGSPIQIRINEDEMYISNSGLLPRDWTVETLMKNHRSQPFNPSIANVFFRAGYIEAWGRGIQKICEACKKFGIPNPEYTILGDTVMIKFTARKFENAIALETPNRHNVGLDVGLDVGLEKKILELISANTFITTLKISEELSITKRSVERYIKKLKEQGNILRVGGKRYGHWEIVK